MVKRLPRDVPSVAKLPTAPQTARETTGTATRRSARNLKGQIKFSTSGVMFQTLLQNTGRPVEKYRAEVLRSFTKDHLKYISLAFNGVMVDLYTKEEISKLF